MKSLLLAVAVFVGRWLTKLYVLIAKPFLQSVTENTNGVTLDPDLGALLSFCGPFSLKEFLAEDLERARALASFDMRVTGLASSRVVSVEEHRVNETDAEIPLRVYDPAPGEELPGCLFYHGGGFVIGNLDSHDSFCRFLARKGDCRVFAVDYRRAPEHSFPAAVEDAVASFRWVRDRADRFTLEPNRLAVAGDSAGATLATVVCQDRIERDGVRPDRQLLLYPPTDFAGDYASRHGANENLLLSWEAVEWFGEQYVGDREVDPETDHRISPLHFDSLEGMPPTVIATAGFDPLRDEGLAYARELEKNGVDVRHEHYEQLAHGFVTFGGVSRSARKAAEDLVHVFREL